ncbi:hypothetical protein AKUH3B204M_14000 [Apilactobacillus kunkeei]|nr:hypothetical protein AKUH3B204M_14000 [Apilactobacillus kunkeei]CAI2668062.1 hypothetical protein AKUA0901_14630 [Apilactobacillus kunkeei]CAI2668188.1 hypothetical protein AKUA1802_14640 [Apilactobacillus kunkeei]CAI2670204.1 hypothetical protein AKUA1201_14620 [Apilactobacillus kunkeei]CAI2672426.1 hypothetical protein AKUH4B206J_14800 [Apilactobacillus kunkeei]
MKKEIKEKKVLHKVKKNWVVIGMASVTLLGAGYVAAQNIDTASTSVVAHADVKSSDYSAPSNNVSVSVDNQSNSSSENPLKFTSPVIYHINLKNNDNAGRVIPKGTQIRINFTTPNNLELKNILKLYTAYTQSNDGNTYDASIDNNSVVVTLNQNLYPGEYNIYVSMAASNVSYAWNGDTTEHETNPDVLSLGSQASYDYNNEGSKSVSISNGSVYILPVKKADSSDNDSNKSAEGVPPADWAPVVPFDRPSDSKYPYYYNPMVVSFDSSNSTAQYTPIVKSTDGVPYLISTARFNKVNDPNVTGEILTITNGDDANIDSSHVGVYAKTDKGYVDITNQPGVIVENPKAGSGISVDFSNSAYNHSMVALVAYIPVNDLTKKYSTTAWLNWTENGKQMNQIVGTSHYNIIMTDANKGKPWIIAPNNTIYTDVNGDANVSLLGNINGFVSDDNGTTITKLNNITVTNSGGLQDGNNYLQSGSKNYVVSYELKNGNDVATASRNITIINPFEKVNEKVTSSVTAHYIDETNNKEISSPTVQSIDFSGEGIKDSRNGSISWETFTPVSGDTTYTLNSKNITNYKLSSDSESVIQGKFNPLTGNVDEYFKYEPFSNGSESNNTNSSAESSSAQSSSAQSSSAESSSAQSSSAESSSAQSSSAESSSAQSSSAESSSAQSSSAESSSAQSSSAESSSAQSSSAESSSAQSSSAESSSAQSSSAESSSAQSSSAESSSAQSSSAVSSNAQSSASSHVVVPSSSSSHGNNNGNPSTDKHEISTPNTENHKNNGVTPSVENNTSANNDAKRLPQTGDQTHENVLVAIGTALIAMALGLVFFGSRRRRK